MARTKWNIFTQTGSGGSWELQDDIFYAPNANLEKDKTGTLIQAKLANGGNAYTSPEVKYNYEPMNFMFIALDPTNPEDVEFISNLNSYIDNATFLKIVDHDSGEIQGIFTSLKEVWISGSENDKDYSATFARVG